MEKTPETTRPVSSRLEGAGLGLRRGLIDEFCDALPSQISFLEIAPENWIDVGGRYGKQFRGLLEKYPLACHGLSLSIAGPEPLDHDFLKQLKTFLDEHNVPVYSEHLSYCSDHGHLYDLMPVPFTGEAVGYVASRVKEVQHALERRIALENISYYAAPHQELDEAEFVCAVLEEADCDLLLDVNNIYVNSINHRYDAHSYMDAMPAERVVQFHVAGHYVEAEDLRIDTHGAPVCDPVYELLADAYQRFGPVPTLLERDFNLPPLAELLEEADRIIEIQSDVDTAKGAGHERQAV